MTQKRNWSDLIILLLLPAPLTFIAVILAAVYVIASEDLTSSSDESDTVSQAAESAEVSSLSSQAAAIATVNAAPVRQSSSAETVNTTAEGDVTEVASSLNYDPAIVERGRENFIAICSACHGTDARGIAGLGKTLIDSEFVNSLDDAGLHEFIVVGRTIWDPLNTTGVAMPARGGNPGLTDEDIDTIVAYIRVLNGTPGAGTAAGAETATTGTEGTTTDTTFTPIDVGSITGGGETTTETTEAAPEMTYPVDVSAFLSSLGVTLPDPPEWPERTGEAVYNEFCGIRYDEHPQDFCDFLTSTDLDAEALTALITSGNPIWSDPNEIGVHIPPRLGYPVLTDNEIKSFVEYLLNQ